MLKLYLPQWSRLDRCCVVEWPSRRHGPFLGYNTCYLNHVSIIGTHSGVTGHWRVCPRSRYRLTHLFISIILTETTRHSTRNHGETAWNFRCRARFNFSWIFLPSSRTGTAMVVRGERFSVFGSVVPCFLLGWKH